MQKYAYPYNCHAFPSVVVMQKTFITGACVRRAFKV